MRLEFTLNFAEFEEAQQYHKIAPAKRARALGFIMVGGVALACVLYSLGKALCGPPAFNVPDPLMNEILLPTLPWVIMLACSALVLRLRGALINRQPWNESRKLHFLLQTSRWGRIKGILWHVGWLLFYLSFFAFESYQINPQTGRIEADLRHNNVWLVPIIVWTMYSLWAVLVNQISTRDANKSSWDLQEHLHRPTTMEFTAGCVAVSGPFSNAQFQWPYFPGCRETPALFLLYVSPAMFHIIPKRAFTSEEDLNGFRNMAQNLIGKSTGGFSVLPIPPAPLPAPEPAR